MSRSRSTVRWVNWYIERCPERDLPSAVGVAGQVGQFDHTTPDTSGPAISGFGAIVNEDGSVTISGSAPGAAVVVIAIEGGGTVTVLPDENGDFSTVVNLPPGTHNISGVAIDGEGQKGPVAETSVTVPGEEAQRAPGGAPAQADTEQNGPSISGLQAVVNEDGSVTISGSAPGAALIVIELPGGNTVFVLPDENGDFSTVVNLPPGTHTIGATAYDSDRMGGPTAETTVTVPE